MENDDVRIEFSADCVIVEVDGVKAEVRGVTDVRAIKRAAASQLLYAIAEQPRQRDNERRAAEMQRERAQYGEGQQLAGSGLLAPAANRRW